MVPIIQKVKAKIQAHYSSISDMMRSVSVKDIRDCDTYCSGEEKSEERYREKLEEFAGYKSTDPSKAINPHDMVKDELSVKWIEEHMQKTRVPKRAKKWSEYEGGYCSIDRMLDGRPYLLQQRKGTEKAVTIIVQVGENCDIASDQMRWKALAVASICNAISAHRIPVRVYAVSACTGQDCKSRDESWYSVQVKRDGDKLNLSSLCAVVQARFFRTYFFGAFYNTIHNDPKRKLSSGLGSSASAMSMMDTDDDYITRNRIIVIDKGECLDQKSAETRITHEIENNIKRGR